MSKMLDIIEKALCLSFITYVRLDGGTRTEMRQYVVERFNNDPKKSNNNLIGFNPLNTCLNVTQSIFTFKRNDDAIKSQQFR